MALAALLAPYLVQAPASSAQKTPAEVHAEARQLRDQGELEEAAATLRSHLARTPGDVDARWLLAQTLYWLGDLDGARREYERALGGRPGDATLRLDLVRFLVETGQARRARAVLAPLLPELPGLPTELTVEARRLEREVARLSAPWASLELASWDDAQPLTGRRLRLEIGGFPAEGVAVALQVAPARLEGAVPAVEVSDYLLTLTLRRAGSRLEADLAAGLSQRAGGSDEGIGTLALALRLPGDLRLQGEASRSRYLWTERSLAADLMVDTLELAIDRSGAPDWAGRVGGRLDRFPDGNEVVSLYGWFLAPLVRRPGGSLRLGYAFQLQDSEESRFTPDGVYDPYYTPEELVAHSLVAAVSLVPTATVALHLDGAYGIQAQERASAPDPGGGLLFETRELTPWRARARLEAELTPRLRMLAQAEHQRTAFFEITSGSLGITVRFPR